MSTNLITLSEGAAMTALFRSEKENILDTRYQNSGILPICESFDRTVFDSLLALENCMGLRIYCGMDSNLNIKMVVCGIDSHDEDVYLPPARESEEPNVIELGIRCPDNCPPASKLNS